MMLQQRGSRGIDIQAKTMQSLGCRGSDAVKPHGNTVIDLGSLRRSPSARSAVVEDIGRACADKGFFHVVNHGISSTTMDGALQSAEAFFGLPAEDKGELVSSDVRRPVRCFSSAERGGEGLDNAQPPPQRSFLKKYAHPIDDWIGLWPSNPPSYRAKMGRYSTEVRRLALELMEAIAESLGLGRAYMKAQLEEGMQLVVVNSYPTCRREYPPPVGIPPHTDYANITILLQCSDGLEVLEAGSGRWEPVPAVPGSLYVQVGNILEVLSNGRYKSAVHRAVLNPTAARTSVASLHGLPMAEEMGVAAELVDERNPKRYRESTFQDFLAFLSENQLGNGPSFIDTLKLA